MSVYQPSTAPSASSHFASQESGSASETKTTQEPKKPAAGDKNSVISERTGKPKRRKAVRACIHCQRTHLTCDNNRPCERCVQRGFADTCRDGVRKKAKYLGGDFIPNSVPDASARRPARKYDISHTPSVSQPVPQLQAPSSLSAMSAAVPVPPQVQAELNGVPYYDQYAGPTSGAPPHRFVGPHQFQSQTTDLEYSVLGNILQVDQSESSPSFSDDSGVHHRTPSLPSYQPRINNYNLNQQSLSDILFQHEQQTSTPFDDWIDYRPPPISLTIHEKVAPDPDPATSSLEEPYLQPQQSVPNRRLSGLLRTKSSTTVMTMARGQQRTPAEIYQSVTRPFPYTPGFHALIRYLKSRFSRADLMEIVRSMASYRPSFIAITNSLTEDDLVFMEKYFQRTLLEYEKYFVYSGTPTIVWRRTGQIAAVGHEFCVLSGWPMETLLNSGQGTGRFIVEVMDNQSVVDYFRMFSDISFNDSTGSIMSTCTLVSPQGQPVKTSCVLTLRKDLFGIPMMMIGNFLPILG